VDVLSYFNGPWRQPRGVLSVTGEDGVHLGGPFVEPLDPDLDEDQQARVRASFICLAPPCAGHVGFSNDELNDAIQTVRAHRFDSLTGKEGASKYAIDGVVRGYLALEGIRERGGWSGNEVLPGVVEVCFSYWDGERAATARWRTTPASGTVRYCNRDAKRMSWWPTY
jgi:hypothetical protein